MIRKLSPLLFVALLGLTLTGCSTPRTQQTGADLDHKQCRQWHNELVFEGANPHNMPARFSAADQARVTRLYRQHGCEAQLSE